ncbi:MAG: tripartite tricarboxylate transporter substrate binding protein [bacterium]|nr:tripartite tricarboxylate transporter substrate binding protein [bacterium]
MKKRISVMLMLSLCVMSFSASIVAAEYPEKPIKIIVPYGAGGGTDTTTRIIQKALDKILPQPVVIVNMGGAASVIGSRELLKSEPDGYTMLVNIINVWTNKVLGTADFGAEAFQPVAQCGTYYLVEVTRPESPYNNLAEMIEAAKSQPDTVKVATNIGAITHFTTLALQDAVGSGDIVRLVHIGDGASRISNVLGGHIDSTIMGNQETKGYYDSGEMKLLAVYAPERIEGYEDVPTAREQGIEMEQAVSYWFFMPEGTPMDRVNYMADALEKAMNDPELIERMAAMTMIPSYLRGEALEKHIEEEGAKIQAIAEKHNLVGSKKEK